MAENGKTKGADILKEGRDTDSPPALRSALGGAGVLPGPRLFESAISPQATLSYATFREYKNRPAGLKQQNQTQNHATGGG